MEHTKETLGRNLSFLIRRLGKTRKQFALECGIAPTTFNEWCAGNTMPGSAKLDKVATKLGVHVSDLYDEDMIAIINERNEEDIKSLHPDDPVKGDAPDPAASSREPIPRVDYNMLIGNDYELKLLINIAKELNVNHMMLLINVAQALQGKEDEKWQK